MMLMIEEIYGAGLSSPFSLRHGSSVETLTWWINLLIRKFKIPCCGIRGKERLGFYMKNKLSIFDLNAGFSPSKFLEVHFFTNSNFQADFY